MKYFGEELIKINNLYVYFDMIINIIKDTPTHSNTSSTRLLLDNFYKILETLPEELYRGAFSDYEFLKGLYSEKKKIVDILVSLSHNDKVLIDTIYGIINEMEDKNELKNINQSIEDNNDIKFIKDVLLNFPENIRKTIWKDIKLYKLNSPESQLVW